MAYTGTFDITNTLWAFYAKNPFLSIQLFSLFIKTSLLKTVAGMLKEIQVNKKTNITIKINETDVTTALFSLLI